ncbi:MAG TPA: anthranilate phosphoribosyltransferase [Blastocatellia bacterium]|nr:anthranilate phosphoribosyltransferase [Blastocatellia bacterium]
MLKEILVRLLEQGDMTRSESAAVLEMMIDGKVNDVQIAAILTALSVKGPTVDELTGFAETMRRHAVKIQTKHKVFLDTAGTGGDGSKTFNISTAASFVIAAAGVPVAKHGSKAATSISGAADTLAALGMRIDAPPEVSAKALDEIGICFLLAPFYHPAMSRVGGVRRQLGMQTVFNLLGPLTNPAGAPRQLLGVFSDKYQRHVAQALANLGSERAWVVRGYDGMDEISVCARTRVAEVKNGEVRIFYIEPDQLGLKPVKPAELVGGDAAENAKIVRDVLTGERRDGARDAVVANAAAGLILGGITSDLEHAVAEAGATIDSGAAYSKLQALIEISNS